MFKWFRRGGPADAETREEDRQQEQIEQQQAEKIQQAVQPTRTTWFSRVTQLFQRAELTEELWDELEEALISADVGVETTEELLEAVRDRVRRTPGATPDTAREFLKEEMLELLAPADLAMEAPPERPWVVLVVGVNGSGKTTSIGKLAYSLRQRGQRVLLAAADTFRAGAVEQLRLWGERVGVDVIAHGATEGKTVADPGAVAFDAMQAAKGRAVDVLLIDTAGRLHTKVNLMEELKKVRRVVERVDPRAPHEVLLVLDATTGQNGVQQARYFTEAVDVTGVILTKLDGTAKGGIVLAVAAELDMPVLYVGTGERTEDIAPFDPAAFVDALLS